MARASLSPTNNIRQPPVVASQARFSTRFPALTADTPTKQALSHNILFSPGADDDASGDDLISGLDDDADDGELGDWIDGETLIAIDDTEDTRCHSLFYYL